VDGWEVLVRNAFATSEVALVRSQLVGAALVSDDDLPGHLDGWFPAVPVKGCEDVLIFVFESGSFKYSRMCLLGILSCVLFRLATW